MILAEMEDPSTAWHHAEMIDEVFRLSSEYDEGLFGRKHKKMSLVLPVAGSDGLLLDDVADSINERTMAELLAKIQSDGNFLNEGSTSQVDNMANHSSGGYISLKDIDECLMSHDVSTSDETLSAIPEKNKLECRHSRYRCQETNGICSKADLPSPLSASVSAVENIDPKNIKIVYVSASNAVTSKGDLHDIADGKQYEQMRKKPVSQSLAWYQNSRKRKISLSAGSVCRTRNSSQSMEVIQPVLLKCKPADSVGAIDDFVSHIALNNSNMEVYSRIPENCCSNDDGISVEMASLGTDDVQINSCSTDVLTDILPVDFSVHNVDGYLWDTSMHLFDDEDGLTDFSPNAVKNNNDSFSLHANMLGIIADSYTCDVKNENQYTVDYGTKAELLSSQNIKCELPSDCLAFPDEIFAGTLPSFEEADVSLHDVNNEDSKEVRRRPGRPRKKSLSQSVVWYRSHRKRQVSISNSSFSVTLSSSSREHSWDEAYTSVDRRRHCQSKRYTVEMADSTSARKGARRVGRVARKSKPVTGRRRVSRKLAINEQRHYSWGSSYEADCRSTTISCDSDDDDAIVDVVTVSSGETFSMTDSRSYLPLINAFHNYCASPNTATVHKQARDPSSETKFKLVWSPERRSSALPSSSASCSSSSRLFMASSTSSTRCSSSKSRPSSSTGMLSSVRGSSSNRRVGMHVRKAGFNKAAEEQRSKREALNDLERQRRREMTREITALRVVVPGVRDNPRAAKVTILNSASTHIRTLERTLERNKALLAAEMHKMAQFKARLAVSSTQ